MGIAAAITAVASVAGTGVSIYGQQQQKKASQEMAAQNQAIVQQEQRQAELQKQAMELDARRRQMQLLRSQQIQRASALATTTNQNASFGSALPGAYGSISGQYNTNSLGVAQSLSLGEQNFGITGAINNSRFAYAGAQGDYASGAALSSLGGSIVNLGPTLGRIGGSVPGFFNSGSSPLYGWNTSGWNGYKG